MELEFHKEIMKKDERSRMKAADQQRRRRRQINKEGNKPERSNKNNEATN